MERTKKSGKVGSTGTLKSLYSCATARGVDWGQSASHGGNRNASRDRPMIYCLFVL